MGESISAAMARTSSCWVIARPRPRRLPSTSRRYLSLSESFIGIADRNNNIANCNIWQDHGHCSVFSPSPNEKPGAPYLPGFGRREIPQVSTPILLRTSPDPGRRWVHEETVSEAKLGWFAGACHA